MERETPRVVKVVKENQDISSVFIEGYAESFAKRQAGSFLTLKIMQNGEWSKPHPFTISCAPEDDLLRVTIKRQGEFTSRVHELEPGSPVLCAGPYGVFCKDIDSADDIVMIAGGVGITPFLSVLRHFRNTHARNRVVLAWSNKTLDDAFGLDELKEMTREIPLRVVHSLSREPEGADMSRYAEEPYPNVFYEPGRCTRDLLKKHLPASNPAAFVCGPPPMQDFVVGELSSLGFDPASVKKESFTWKGAK